MRYSFAFIVVLASSADAGPLSGAWNCNQMGKDGNSSMHAIYSPEGTFKAEFDLDTSSRRFGTLKAKGALKGTYSSESSPLTPWPTSILEVPSSLKLDEVVFWGIKVEDPQIIKNTEEYLIHRMWRGTSIIWLNDLTYMRMEAAPFPASCTRVD